MEIWLFSNGDLILSASFFGEFDLSESALLFVDTDVGVCGRGSAGSDGNPDSNWEFRLVFTLFKHKYQNFLKLKTEKKSPTFNGNGLYNKSRVPIL